MSVLARAPRRLRILTWHVHGNYLYYLSQVPHDFLVVTKPGDPPGYARPGPGLTWGDNVQTIDAAAVKHAAFDCVLYQSRSPYEHDHYDLLTEQQRVLPAIYVEHDPPQQHPTNTLHWFQQEGGLLIHVTPFNALMWDNGITPSRVIEHGVMIPEHVCYRGDFARGIAVVNHLKRRGRRLGADVFETVRRQVAIDLVGMEAEASGGLGEVSNLELPAFLSRYRYFFNPIRYTSLGLAVIEAMMVGLPIVGLATTEMSTAVINRTTGYVDTRIDRLIEVMHTLEHDPDLAQRWGAAAREYALERFSIQRFIHDWNGAFELALHIARS